LIVNRKVNLEILIGQTMLNKFMAIHLILVFSLISCNVFALNESGFVTPPDSAKPWVYWYWMNGNSTKEGIKADLESMKKAGIGGAMQFDIGMGPSGPLLTRSSEWLDVVKYTLVEAEKLGLKVGFNCPGWANSGGPWIEPEFNMQELTWTETFVEGPKEIKLRLKEPARRLGTYKDIAVFAFPTIASDSKALNNAKLAIKDVHGKAVNKYHKMFDGDTDTVAILPGTFDIELSEPLRVQSVFVRAPHQSRFFKADLMAWDDNSNQFIKVKAFEFTQSGLNDRPSIGTASFQSVTSKKFRFAFKTGYGASNAPAKKMYIAELNMTGGHRLDKWANKAGFGTGRVLDFSDMTPKAEDVIPLNAIKDITSKVAADGTLKWNVPDGNWTVIRLGYIPTGAQTEPLPAGISSLEVDKLSKKATDIYYDGMMKPILEAVGPELAKKVVSNHHIDSFESGWQNWSDNFDDEFSNRRGYNISKYWPALTGRIVKDTETTEHFLWDFRRTISDCYADNHISQLALRCHEDDLFFSTEAYDGPFEYLQASGRSDVPMVEIWANSPIGSRPRMAPIHAAHIYEKQIIATEQYTAPAKWENHPYNMKPLADYTYTVGVNRFALHVFTQQPWVDPKMRPGMTLGPWGAHTDRGNTWWDKSYAWHEYLTRCQYVLQQGSPVADILYFLGEDAPNGGGNNPPTPPFGYEGDGLNAEILGRLKVIDNKYILPKGKQYRYIVMLDDVHVTLKSMKHLVRLVYDGGTLVGSRPNASPSLSDYMRIDEFKNIVEKLWGAVDSDSDQKQVGQGRVIWGKKLEDVLSSDGLAQDFTYDRNAPVSLNYTHRIIGDFEVYFVASSGQADAIVNATFRVNDKRPELWYPDSGRTEMVACYKQSSEGTTIPLKFGPSGSVFVVFRKPKKLTPTIVKVAVDDREIVNADATLSEENKLARTFTVSLWAKPSRKITLPQESSNGLAWDNQSWALYPAPGHQIFGDGQSGVGVSVGTNGVCVMEHWAFNVAPVLVYKASAPLEGWTHIAVVYQNNKPTLYVNGKAVGTGLSSGQVANFKLTPSPGLDNCKITSLFTDNQALGSDSLSTIFNKGFEFNANVVAPEITIADNNVYLNAWDSGVYEITYSNGKKYKTPRIEVPKPLYFNKSWKVYFPSNTGEGKTVEFEKLISWPEYEGDEYVKYFSGTATYTSFQDVPAETFVKDRSLYLSLGDVQVMAEVIVNDENLGVYWKPPFMIDVTSVLIPGKNKFEIKVTNTWPNRLIGDEQYPDDCTIDGSWKSGGIPGVPDWVKKNQARPESNRVSFTTWKHWNKDDSLFPAGMLGPVKIIMSQKEVLK
jgi:hypothetical protein